MVSGTPCVHPATCTWASRAGETGSRGSSEEGSARTRGHRRRGPSALTRPLVDHLSRLRHSLSLSREQHAALHDQTGRDAEAARDPDASARQPRGEAAARGTHIRGFLRAVPCHPPSAAREGRPPKPPSFLRSLWCPQRQPPLSPGRLGLGRVRPWAGQSVRLRGRGLLASSTPGLVRARATTRAPHPVRARATTCALRPVRRGQTARGHAATILSFYLKTHDQGPRTSPHSKELQPRPPRRPNTHVYRQRHPAGGENQAGAPGPAHRPCGPEHGPHPSESRRSPAAERCRRPGPYLDQEVPRPQSGLPGHPAFIHRLQVLQRWERGRWRELLDGRVRWKARTPR